MTQGLFMQAFPEGFEDPGSDSHSAIIPPISKMGALITLLGNEKDT